MAQRKDSEYEYRICETCKKSKKVYDKSKPEPLWHWGEWFIDHTDKFWEANESDTERQVELKEALRGCCLECRRDTFEFFRKMGLTERFTEKGEPVPTGIFD